MKKLFTNNGFFLATTIIATLGMTVFTILGAVTKQLNLNLIALYMFASALLPATYISYQRHDKNVMKGLIGALLLDGVLIGVSMFESAQKSFDMFFNPFELSLIVLLFINHFIINSSHKSSQSEIHFNQFLCISLAASTFLRNLMWVIDTTGVSDGFVFIPLVIAKPCFFAVIVCIESRLDAYRIDRENAGWTESQGYPENYVHEFEKKDK